MNSIKEMLPVEKVQTYTFDNKPKNEKADVYHQENRKCQPEAGFYGVSNRLDMRAVSGEKQQAYKENINR